MKQEYLVVEWEIEDGYVGASRPQKTKIPVEDFEEDMTRDEVQNVLQEYVQEDFEQRVGPAFSDLDGDIDKALRIIEERETDG